MRNNSQPDSTKSDQFDTVSRLFEEHKDHCRRCSLDSSWERISSRISQGVTQNRFSSPFCKILVGLLRALISVFLPPAHELHANLWALLGTRPKTTPEYTPILGKPSGCRLFMDEEIICDSPSPDTPPPTPYVICLFLCYLCVFGIYRLPTVFIFSPDVTPVQISSAASVGVLNHGTKASTFGLNVKILETLN
jgi:hypothetical protein